jgi:hypothetical protein
LLATYESPSTSTVTKLDIVEDVDNRPSLHPVISNVIAYERVTVESDVSVAKRVKE